jgi:3-hydroxybutyryl-CoA dehydrogenase
METKIQRVAVIGTGTMGTQIAIMAACHDYQVSAYDTDEGSFKRVQKNLTVTMKTAKKKPMVTMEEWDDGSHKVKFYKELEQALRGADLVIETVPEDLELKREIFGRLDALAPQTAILATNSSSIPISKIEDATARPDRCLNIHFYSLVTGPNMADVMGGTETTAETLETGKAWVRSLGCVPLTVKKEILGFCFNRVWRAIKRETLYMWAEGFVDFRDIDRAWMISYGTSRGPFGYMDNIGLDVVYGIEMVYYNESKDPRDHPPAPLKAKIDRNELGIKTGKGFYSYPDPEYSRPDFIKV